MSEQPETGQPEKKPQVPSPAEWGARVAEQSPPWPDAAWRRACATWGMKIETDGGNGE